MPQVTGRLDLLHLQIGNRGEQFRIPVDQTLVLEDEPFAIEVNKDLKHRGAEALVHRKALTRPVTRRAQTPELIDNRAA